MNGSLALAGNIRAGGITIPGLLDAKYQELLNFIRKMNVSQDLTLKMLVRAGELWGRVYCLRLVKTRHVSVGAKPEDWDVWHRHLGHPSSNVIKCLPRVTGKGSLSAYCDACS
ncbi:uncharacterized protein LOC116208751 [Punica granatum]|nr:uncharacterized protein LOC116208751 [Punica granatum]